MLEQLLNTKLDEFGALKKEQEGRRVTRDNLAYFTLGTLGAVLVAVNQTGQMLFLLGVPFVCLVLGWTRAANDAKIHDIRVYIRDDLAKQTREILAAMPEAGQLASTAQGARTAALLNELWRWESTSTNGRRRRRIINITVDMVLFVLPAIGAPFLAAGALNTQLGAAGATTVIVLSLLLSSLVGWEIAAKTR